MQNPQKNEVFSFFLTEKEVNYLCTFLYPDYKKEIEHLSKCLDDIVILKKALIYGRLRQCSQIQDWHEIIKMTFKNPDYKKEIEHLSKCLEIYRNYR